MKTNELSGAALDWAVAKCEGVFAHAPRHVSREVWVKLLADYAPSTDWAQGGPIIERECITVEYAGVWIGRCWEDSDGDEQIQIEGETPLIAAMRCYVVSKLGDDVQLPEELK